MGGDDFDMFLLVQAPPHVAGYVPVRVTNPDGQYAEFTTNHIDFTYFNYVGDDPLAPVCGHVEPPRGSQFGGETLLLTGQNFYGGVRVLFDNLESPNVVRTSTHSLTCITPAHARGVVEVRVVNLDNQSVAAPSAFTYVAPLPVVSNLAPTTVGPASGGTSLYVGGSGFLPESEVFVGGSRALQTRYINATTLWISTPPGLPGKADVTVVNPGDDRVGTKANAFEYEGETPPPQVAIVSPNRGPVAGGTPITVSGQNFLPGVKVWVGGKEATPVTLHSPIEVSAVTPDGVAGVTNVIVANADGQSSTNATGFTYVSTEPPSIQQPPVNQVVTVGDAVTFSVQATGSGTLSFQWFKGDVALVNANRISGARTATLTIANVAAADADTYRVVINDSLGGSASATASLTVNQPPACTPPPSGLVAWWPMNGSAADWVGTSEPASVSGLSFVPAKVKQGVRFSTGSILDIPDSPDLANPNFTIELWARPDGPGPNPDGYGSIVLSKWSNNNAGYALFWRQTDGRFVYYTGGLNQAIVSAQPHPVGTFYHVAMTREGTAYRLYVDGVLAGEKQVAGDYVHDASVPWTFGGAPPYFRGLGYPRTFIGVLDEVTMYRRALAPGEIAALHAAGAGGKCGVDTPAMLTQPLDQFRLEGETATFSAQAVGAAPLAYQWHRDGQALTDDAHYSGTHTNTLTILDLTTNLAGVYRLEVSNAFGQVQSAPARLVVLQSQSLPGVWAARDIGSAGSAGQVAFDAGAFVLEANGTNIAGTRDAFRFVCQPLMGDGEIRARLSRLDPTDPEAVAGLMIREGLSPGAAHAFTGVTAGKGSSFLNRSRFGVLTTGVVPDDGVAAPCWVNLRRHGEWLAGYRSADGVQWTLVGAARVPMADAVQVGLAATSHAQDVLTTAVFEEVEVISGTPALTGGLEQEGWNTRDVLDHSIAGWQTNPQYGGPPLMMDVLPQIETIGQPPGLSWNHYGQRLTGYLIPPTTGEYVFCLASDDESELWLSPNADPAQKQKIIEVTAATAVREWPLHPSAPVQLEANRPYVIEILHVQHWVGSHLGLAWKRPNEAAPVTGDDPIGGPYLAFRLASTNAPTLRSAPTDQSRFVGTEVTFSVHVQGASRLRYRWLKDGVELDDDGRVRGAGTACLTINKVQLADAGAYRVTVSNASGEVQTGPARLTVVPPASAPVLSQSQDFGSGAEPGTSSYADGAYAIQGSSRFVYAPLTGDGGIVARLTSFDDAKTQFTAGLGVLEKLDPTSAILSLVISGNQGVVWSYRPAGGTSTSLFGEGRVPYWLQVTRQGQWFTARKSLDGVTWDLVNRFTNSLPLTVQMGLAIGTGAITNLTSATFDSVQLGSLAEDTRGGLLREAWAEGGYNISNLVNNPKYPNAPVSQSIITQFLTDDVPPGAFWVSYGQRLSGYLIPPVTGDYVFYLGGDNAAQLWLSGSSDPAGKQLIAEVTTATTYLDWNSPNGPTRSNPIHLEAGQWRYVEVLHVQQWEGSWVGVNWKRPDTDLPVVGEFGILSRYLAYALPGHEAPVIVQQPSDAARGVGDTVTFGVLASGTPPLFYQWRKGNTDLADDQRFSGTRTRELAIANVQVSDSGYYSVVITNPFGRTNSVAAALSVAACELAPAGLIGWWPGDGNARDLVGTNHGVLQKGATATASGLVGQAFHFDGTDDYMEVADSPDLATDASFTVVTWVKPTVPLSQQPSWARLVDKYYLGSSSLGRRGWALLTSGNYAAEPGRLKFEVADGTGTSSAGWKDTITVGGDLAPIDRWTHAAGVYDRRTGTLRLYVNGLVQAQRVIGTYGAAVTSAPLRLGCDSVLTSRFKGDLDEVALLRRALSAEEIAALYAAGLAGLCKDRIPPLILAQPQSVTAGAGGTVVFSVRASGTAPLAYRWAKDNVELNNGPRTTGADTATLTIADLTAADAGLYAVTVSNPFGTAVSDPGGLAVATDCYPPPASLVGWWTGDGSGQDSAGSNHATNTSGISYSGGRVDQSFVFDNTNDRLIIPHRDACNPGAAGFSVHFWMKGTTSQPQSTFAVLDKSHTDVDNTGWVFQGTASSGGLSFIVADGTGTWPGAGTTNTGGVLDSRWHHVAGTWDGATIRFYVDGVLHQTRSSARASNNSRPLNVGFWWGGGSAQRFFRGQIDEVAIHDRALSRDEVALLYDLGVNGSGFCKSPAIFQPPVDLAVRAGDTATFSVAASGGLPLSYQWFKDNAALTDSAHVLGATSDRLIILNAQSADAGLHSVQVSNPRGSASAGPARLTVNPAVPASDWLWGRQSTSLNDWTEAWTATTDAAGNAYVSGTFKGVVDFGTNRLLALAPSDFFLAKYDAEGVVQWARQGSATDTYFTNLIATAGYGVVVDSLGNTYVAGSFAGTNFPHGVYAITSKGDADIFLAKYDPNGMLSHTWSVRAGGTGWDAAQALAIDGNGNLYVTGQLGSDTADFGSNVARRAGGADVFIAKYSAAGVNLWVRTAGGPRHDMGYGIAVDAAGNAYVTGYFEGRAQFGTNTVTAAGLSDVFLARYNSAGTCEWVRPAGGAANESAFAITLIGADRIGITGYFQGAATFGTTSLPSPGTGRTDLFVAEYDRSGNLLWVRPAGGTNVYGRALAVDQAGRLYLTGILGGAADFGGHPLSVSGAVDLFLAAYDATGDVVWNRAGGQPYAYANGLACDATGDLIAVGAFSGRAQFGPNLLAHANGLAAFTAKASAISAGGAGDCTPPPSGLLGWWPGDGTAADLAGGNSGTSLNGATYAAGNVGQAFRFDGVDDAVDLGSKLVLGPAFTEMAWIFSQVQDDTWHGFLGYEPAGGYKQRAPGLWVYQRTRLHAGFGDGSNWNEITTDPVLRPNAWNHVAVTFDRTNYTAYVNGVPVLSTDAYKGRVPYSTPLRYIGRANDYFAGLVDEVAVFNRALTATEIASIRAAGHAGMCAELPPFILVQPVDQTKDEGATATFAVTARGSEPLTYQWWKGEVALTNDLRVGGAQGGTLTIANLRAEDGGRYRVVVRNARGTAESAPAWLQVQSPNCTSSPSGLLAWWPAEGSANDAAGAGYHGTLNGNAAYAAGAVGQAFSFNGGVDGVLLAPNSLNSSFAALTLEGWVYPTELGHLDSGGYRYGRTLFSTTENAGYAFRVMDGWLQADLRLSGGRVTALLTNALPIALRANAWAHVALTYDGAQVRGYVNGTLVGTAPASGPVIPPATIRTAIGNEANATGIEPGDWGWRGRIDELSVYNRALAIAEVSALAAAGAGKCRGDLPMIVAHPQSATTNAGASVTFRVQATSAVPMTAQWSRDGQPLRGATSLALSLARVAPADAGGYSLVLANTYGAVTSRVAQLTVLMVEPPRAPQITRQPVGSTNNVGATVTLSVQATGTPPLTYQWRRDNSDLPNATNATLTLANLRPADAGDYAVLVANQTGTQLSASARVAALSPIPDARPDWVWVYQPGPANAAVPLGLAVGADRNVWVGGGLYGKALFGSKPLESAPGQDNTMFLAQMNPAGVPQQAFLLEPAGDGAVGGIQVDRAGNLLVVGGWESGLYLARLDGLGKPLWTRRWVSAADSECFAMSLATAADGTIYLNAILRGTAVLGGSTLVSRGDADTVLAKYNRDGALLWHTLVSGRGTDQPAGVGVDSLGAVFSAGSFTMTLTVGQTNLTPRAEDVFLVKHGAGGDLRWAISLGGASQDRPTTLAVDCADHVYLAGAFAGTTELGAGHLPSAGGRDVFLTKIDASGRVLWARSAGGAGDDGEPVLALDPEGNAYLGTVSTSATLAFGTAAVTNASGMGLIVIAKYDPDGNLAWIRSAAGSPATGLFQVAPDEHGNIYAAGVYEGQAAFGQILIANRTAGMFLAKLGFAPVILAAPPLAVTTNSAATVHLTVRAAGAEPLTYTWTKDGTTIAGATGPNLVLTGLAAGSVGTYRVTVSNPYGTTPTVESRVAIIAGGLANVRAAQRPGTNLVEIAYDLGGTAPVEVTVAASADGGKTWTVPVTTLTGDVGPGIRPGADRRFVWSAGTDWLNHQTANFVVRLTIPGMQVTTPSFPVDTMQAGAWRLRVWADLNGNGTYDEIVEGRNEGLAGAEVYYGGRTEASLLPGRTEADGTIAVTKPASAGQIVFARHRLVEAKATRPFHDAVGGLMYTLWLDSDRGGTDGSDWDGEWLSRTLASAEVAAARAGQIIPVRAAHPVFEWHLVAALEPGDAAFAERVMLGLAQASAYLFNVTDGQMKFGQVAIYPGVSTNAAIWHNADLIVFAENEYRANAALNGMMSPNPGWQMRFGVTSRQSFPDEPMYFSSFVHEFGHYAFGFMDEYLDGNGEFDPWEEYRKQHPDKTPGNYGLMDRDFLFPELSSYNDYLDRYPAPLAPATVTDQLYDFWKKTGFLLPCWPLRRARHERGAGCVGAARDNVAAVQRGKGLQRPQR